MFFRPRPWIGPRRIHFFRPELAYNGLLALLRIEASREIVLGKRGARVAVDQPIAPLWLLFEENATGGCEKRDSHAGERCIVSVENLNPHMARLHRARN